MVDVSIHLPSLNGGRFKLGLRGPHGAGIGLLWAPIIRFAESQEVRAANRALVPGENAGGSPERGKSGSVCGGTQISAASQLVVASTKP